MVALTRTKQGDFSLADCIDWSVFESAASAHEKGEPVERDGQGLAEWERTLIEHLR